MAKSVGYSNTTARLRVLVLIVFFPVKYLVNIRLQPGEEWGVVEKHLLGRRVVGIAVWVWVWVRGGEGGQGEGE